MKEAAYTSPWGTNAIECRLCPHHCKMTEGKRGICLTRQNIGGKIYALNYHRPVSSAIDPIEKKPLYHYYPGSAVFSTGPSGCTFKCSNCQNASISQVVIPAPEVTTSEILRMVQESQSLGIAYTYSEPSTWYESIMAVGPELRKRGYRNILVTNGFFEEKPLQDLLAFVDAMNIDIKSIRQDFYKRICKGRLDPVLRACEQVKARCHLEITNLVIPGLNDSNRDLEDLARHIYQHLGPETPLHLSRYFPRYRMDVPQTPLETMSRAWDIARDYLKFVYIGNAELPGGGNTLCTSCNRLLIERRGYQVNLFLDRSHKGSPLCPDCATPVPVIM